MKIGSLVECVNEDFGIQRIQNSKMGMLFPVKNKVYTVRHIFTTRDGRCGLTLAEIDNSNLSRYTPSKLEPAFRHENFRELLPPMQITLEQFENETV